MPTPRLHYKERIAHAEGYEIQFRRKDTDTFQDCEPQWDPTCQYRIKPEPKPDVVREARADLCGNRLYVYDKDPLNPNLRLTFDGETGKLKAAEVI